MATTGYRCARADCNWIGLPKPPSPGRASFRRSKPATTWSRERPSHHPAPRWHRRCSSSVVQEDATTREPSAPRAGDRRLRRHPGGVRHAAAAGGLHRRRRERWREALQKAVELLPDIIITELSMPIMDGWETIRRLRADDRTRRIPIIACRGEQAPRGTHDAWADALLTKPVPDGHPAARSSATASPGCRRLT
jgi:CheY-like chemotaxis protein